MNIFSLGADWLNNILNTIWLSICSVLYKFINWLYQVFENVARVNLFSEEVFQEITSRIYIVMGIAMLFIFAYNLVLMIVNPDDKKSTGATTKIVKETIVSLVIVILLPTIFNYMYIFQNRILSTNIIGQIIMGGFGSVNSDNCDPDDYECNCDFSEFDELKNYGTGEDKSIFVDGFTEGSKDVYQSLIDSCNEYKNDLTDSQRGAYSIAPTIFSAFYRPATFDMDDCEEYLLTGDEGPVDTEQKQQVCINFFYDIEMSKFTGNVDGFVNDDYLTLTMSTDEGIIDFDWLFAIVAGGIAVWMFLCYAMEIGVRVAKLGVLQIISPITVMMRIIPGQKEKIYKKWFDQLSNTYLDVFIRLTIIYFSLFSVSLVPEVMDTLFASFYAGQSNWFIETLALVIVILGILKFAQEAPELIKDFFGSSGNFTVKSPAKQLKENKLAMGGLGAMGAGAASMAGNMYNARKSGKGWGKTIASGAGGLAGGARRGAQNGFKSKDLSELKKGIMQAKYDSDAARDKHSATRERGKIGNKEIPVISSVVGNIKDKTEDVKTTSKNFGDFITGKGATEFRAQAVADALGRVTNIKATFKNAYIEGIENAQSKTNEEYNSNKKINVAGVDYNREADGKWHGNNGSVYEHNGYKDNDGNYHKGMNDIIKEYFDEAKKSAYASRYADNPESYAEANKAMIKSLSDNMNKIGNDFSSKLFDKLKDPNGLNMNISNMSEFSDEIQRLQESGNYEKLYSINEGIEDVLKKQRMYNDTVLTNKKDK